MFVIRSTNDENKVSYYAVDRDGDPYWSTSLGYAKFFQNEGEAHKELRSDGFTRPLTFTDGSTAPPKMVWSAARINFDTKPKGSVTISVYRYDFDFVETYSVVMNGELKGYNDLTRVCSYN